MASDKLIRQVTISDGTSVQVRIKDGWVLLDLNHGDLVVSGIEVKHWGARMRSDTYRGWTGFVVEREGKRLLIGGDTAQTPLFREHRRHDAAGVERHVPLGGLRRVEHERVVAPLHAGPLGQP